MESNKSPGIDKIAIKNVKENLDVLTPIIQKIINNSIRNT